MNYEEELLKIFGLEKQHVAKLELTFEPHKIINLKAKLLIGDKHGEEVVTLLKKYKIEESKDEQDSLGE